MKKIILVLSFFLLFINHSNTQTINVSTGSFIINMGVMPQTIANGLRPYGMVYDLVKNHEVPVYWCINPNKLKDGIDFSHNGVDYRGGTFIVPAEYRNATINARITFWQGQGVVGQTSVAPITVPIFQKLTSFPRWALDFANGGIAQGYLNNAMIPATAYSFKTPAQLDCCNDLFAMPHADPTWATHSNLLSWNTTCRGSIFAACHAVSAMEDMFNPSNPSQQTNFLSNKTGLASGGGPWSQNALVLWGNHGAATPPYTHQFPTSYIAQYMGVTDAAHLNGSEQVYLPVLSGSWRSTTQIIAFDPTQLNVPSISPGPAAITAFGNAFGDTMNGTILYMAGHSHNKGSINDVAAQRAFMNWSFYTPVPKSPRITATGLQSSYVSGITYNLSATAVSIPAVASYTYQWTSTCGGTFSNATGASTTFTPPNVVSNTPCAITLKVSDPCGRSTLRSETVLIKPANRNPIANSNSGNIAATCASTGLSLTLNVVSNDSDPDGDPFSITAASGNNGSWSFNAANGTVTYQPTQGFTGTATGSYTITDTAGNTANAAITINVGTIDVNGCTEQQVFAANDLGFVTSQSTFSGTINNGANITGAPDEATAQIGNNGAGVITVDFGVSIPAGRQFVMTWLSGSNSVSSVTMQYSPDNSTYTASGLGTISTVATHDELQEYTFTLPAAARYLRITRSANRPEIDAISYEIFSCVARNPVAGNDSRTVLEDVVTKINVLSNDNDPAGSAMSVRTIVSSPFKGRVSVNPDNTITYVNNLDATGRDSFVYQVCNTEGYCSTAEVKIQISADGCAAGFFRPSPPSATRTRIFRFQYYGADSANGNQTAANFTDAYLRADNTTTIYDSDKLEVGRTPNIRRSVLRFNLAYIPSNAIIQSATFSLHRKGGDGNSQVLNIHNLTQSFVENQVSWNRRSTGPNVNWTNAGGTFNATVSSSATVTGSNIRFNWDITNLVTTWVATPSSNLGFLIKTAESLDKKHDFHSRIALTVSERPELRVTYILPTACIAVTNRAPMANPDYARVRSDSSKTVSVLTNDGDIDGNPITLNSIVGAVTGGSAIVSGTNIIFTPTASFNGNATLLYRISDGTLFDTARLTIAVTNAPPVARRDTLRVFSNTSLFPTVNQVINVQANDQNADGPSPLTTTIVSAPKSGTASVSGINILYTPELNFFGRDTIRYRICEPSSPSTCGEPFCSDTFIYINILNRRPEAVNDVAVTIACQPVVINALNNDYDPEGAPVTLTTIISSTGGTSTIEDQKIRFAPNFGFTGAAVITYRISDGIIPLTFDTATVTVTVNPGTPANQKVIANNDIADDVEYGDNVYIPVSFNDVDPEGTPLTVSLPAPNLTPSNAGTFILNPFNIEFIPAPGYAGPVSFEYQVCDQAPAVSVGCTPLVVTCDTATVTFNILPPIIKADFHYGKVNGYTGGVPITNVFANDSVNSILADTNEVIITLTNNGGITGLTITPNGDVVVPPGTKPGRYYAIYNLCLELAPVCDTALLIIDIDALPPVVTNITRTMSNSNSETTLPALQATSPDGSIHYYTITSLPNPLQGTLSLCDPVCAPITVNQQLSPAQIDNLKFDPLPNFTGTSNFGYTATDSTNIASQPAVYTIVTTNFPPVAQNITIPTISNLSAGADLPPLVAADADGSIASYKIISLPDSASVGELMYCSDAPANTTCGVRVPANTPLSADQIATLTFVPVNTYIGIYHIPYIVLDNNNNLSDTAYITIPVDSVASEVTHPIAYSLLNTAISSNAGQTNLNSLLGNNLNFGDIAKFTITTLPNPTHGVLYLCNPACVAVAVNDTILPIDAANLRFDPNPNFTGLALFNYTVTNDDYNLTGAPATFTIPVTTNPPVSLNRSTYTIKENEVNNTRLPALSSYDIDGTIASYTISSLPPNGTLYLCDVAPSTNCNAVSVNDVLTPAEISQLAYLPDANFTGTDVFNYFATDNTGAVSNNASVSVLVEPIANSIIGPLTEIIDEMTPMNTDVSISDLIGIETVNPIDYYVISALPAASEGKLKLCTTPPSTGCTDITLGQQIALADIDNISFEPALDYTGVATAYYYAVDDQGLLSNVSDIKVTIYDVPPIANDVRQPQMLNTQGATQLSLPLNASDLDGVVDVYRISSIPPASQGLLEICTTPPSTGCLAVSPGDVIMPSMINNFVFTPNSSFNGYAYINYAVRDNNLNLSNPAVVTIPIGSLFVLPLYFIDIKTSCQQLSWTTTNHFDMTQHYIEKMNDQGKWVVIDLIKGTQNQSEILNYQYNFKSNGQLSLYRIRVEDSKGKIYYSPIMTVNCSNVQPIQIQIFPNPASNSISIFSNENLGVVEISNMYGQKVINTTTNEEQINIDIKDLASGVYTIKAMNTVVKFIKQ